MRSRRRTNSREDGLKGKKILLVVTGGISAYKSVFLVRILKRAGADVRVVLSEAAAKFITPLTFEILSENPVPDDLFARRDKPLVEHVELAAWPDRTIVAPATADFIGKLSHGLADDLPSAVLCAAKGEVYLAPAMNDGMWNNPAVQRNIEELKKDGKFFIEPGTGELACGTSGSGRMAEPDEIAMVLGASFNPGVLDGVRFLVTAGRTEEDIDPVRYISNRSSGRMGFAIAERAKELGAHVTVIHGSVDVPGPNVDSVKKVTTASRMKSAVMRSFPGCDVLVMAAAVADYSPVRKASQKIKKSNEDLVIKLRKTPDILEAVRKKKTKRQVVVGFALESTDGEENALKKISSKGCDYLVLNMIGKNTGFGAETNQVTLYKRKEKLAATSVISKKEAAAFIIDRLLLDSRVRKTQG